MKPKPADEEPVQDPQELIDAAQESVTTPELPPEVDETTDELTTWDEAPTASGTQTPERPMDDEANVSELLVDEGIEEADREQRVAAAETDETP